MKLKIEPTFRTIAIVGVFLLNSTNTEQIAGMINLYINLLADKQRRKNLVIGDASDRKKLEFNPQFMICQLCMILINLIVNNTDEDNKKLFLKEIIADTRSFKLDIYAEAKNLFEKFSYGEAGQTLHLGDQDREKMTLVFNTIQEFSQKEDNLDLEIDYDDAPDEFMDAVMFTLMDDPVMLPTSRNVMDRGCIVRQLLNNEQDPFNRAPLTVADLIPMPELKAKIQKYKQKKYQEALNKKNEEKMSVTEDS